MPLPLHFHTAASMPDLIIAFRMSLTMTPWQGWRCSTAGTCAITFHWIMPIYHTLRFLLLFKFLKCWCKQHARFDFWFSETWRRQWPRRTSEKLLRGAQLSLKPPQTDQFYRLCKPSLILPVLIDRFGRVERVKKIKDYAFVHFEERSQAVEGDWAVLTNADQC